MPPSLPHEYPFLLVERRQGERVVAALTANASWARAAAAYPQALAIEILAQAALLLLPGDDDDGDRGDGGPTGGMLAGIDRARFEAPLVPGDRLLAEVEVVGRFGRLIKVAGQLRRQPVAEAEGGGEPVASAGLLLALES